MGILHRPVIRHKINETRSKTTFTFTICVLTARHITGSCKYILELSAAIFTHLDVILDFTGVIDLLSYA